jgi:asparagine N-glycosylation enzyme membrane subunit Stt3
MVQWLSNLSPFETYLIAVPAIMLGSILFLGGIILLLEPRKRNDAETLVAIRKTLEKAGAANGAEREPDSINEADLERVLKSVPQGALALAGIALSLLMLAWLAIYFFVFLPRGPIG